VTCGGASKAGFDCAAEEARIAQGGTVILHCHWLQLTATHCVLVTALAVGNVVGFYTVILLPLLSFSAEMTVSPMARPGRYRSWPRQSARTRDAFRRIAARSRRCITSRHVATISTTLALPRIPSTARPKAQTRRLRRQRRSVPGTCAQLRSAVRRRRRDNLTHVNLVYSAVSG
jgi:hypothetical protein